MSQKTTNIKTSIKKKSKTRAEELLDELIQECSSPEEIVGVEVSADLISTVTDSAIEEVRDWQN